MERLYKNKPYLAFDPEKVEIKESCYIVPKNLVKTLYSGRYCAVSGFIYAIVDGQYSVLANLRGNGVPDYKGFWNCPCGFLEGDEDSKEGIQREVKEECGINLDYNKLKVVFTETDPWICNNGNVTIRHKTYLGKQSQIRSSSIYELNGGEENEVSKISWIPLKEVKDYKWAFNHRDLIFKYAHPKIIRWLLEQIDG